MPISTASVEKSFSYLRHLKTYLRKSTTGTLFLLTRIGVLDYWIKDFEIDTERVWMDFDATGTRRANRSS